MRPPTRSARFLVSALVGAVAAAVTISTLSPTHAPRAAATTAPAITYAALGDGVAAGVGAGAAIAGSPTGCDRTSGSYAALVARAEPSLVSVNVACAGATTKNLDPSAPSAVPASSNGAAAGPQLDRARLHVGPSAKLVTVTVGAADLRLTSVLTSCLSSGCTSEGAIAGLTNELKALPAALDATLAAVKASAPNATVEVVAYPDWVPPTPTMTEVAACAAAHVLSGNATGAAVTTRVIASVAVIGAIQASLNGDLAQAAARTGIHFVNPNLTGSPGQSLKHTWCTQAPWIATAGASATLPTASGQRAIASDVTAAIAADGLGLGAIATPSLATPQLLTSVAHALSSIKNADDALSCPSATMCVAGGSYEDGTKAVQASVAIVTPNHPATSMQLPLPSTDVSSNPQANVVGVSCTSTSSCTAVVDYFNAGGFGVAGVSSYNGHTWSAVSPLPVPAQSANPSYVSASGISCTRPTTCVVVGNFTEATAPDATSVPNVDPYVASELNGTWSANQVLAPQGAPTTNGYALFNAVSCPVTGTCEAVGYYTNASDNQVPLAAADHDGTWSQAVTVAVPPQGTNGLGGLNGVSCPAPGSCVAVGAFAAKLAVPTKKDTSVEVVEGFTTTLHGSNVSSPQPVALLEPVAAWDDAQLSAISCPSVATCLAVGWELTSASGTERAPIEVTLSEDQGWLPPTFAPLPTSTNHYLASAELQAVSCAGPSCAAAGFDFTASNTYLALG